MLKKLPIQTELDSLERVEYCFFMFFLTSHDPARLRWLPFGIWQHRQCSCSSILAGKGRLGLGSKKAWAIFLSDYSSWPIYNDQPAEVTPNNGSDCKVKYPDDIVVQFDAVVSWPWCHSSKANTGKFLRCVPVQTAVISVWILGVQRPNALKSSLGWTSSEDHRLKHRAFSLPAWRLKSFTRYEHTAQDPRQE